jgi:outer membrane murein-binding lipoprotein Lpp
MHVRLSVLGTLILAGCASPYVKVSLVHPHLTGAPAVDSLAAAEHALTKATQRDEHDSHETGCAV